MWVGLLIFFCCAVDLSSLVPRRATLLCSQPFCSYNDCVNSKASWSYLRVCNTMKEKECSTLLLLLFCLSSREWPQQQYWLEKPVIVQDKELVQGLFTSQQSYFQLFMPP